MFLAPVLAAQSWTQLSPSGDLPSPRGLNGTTGVYDPSSNEMIVFGGRDSSGNNLNDVWILTNANGQGGASQWVNLIADGASGSPPARSGHAAVYDTVNNVLIVFGGCSGSCAPALNDVWALSNANGQGGTPAWTELSPAGGPPSARVNSAVVYDQTLNRLVLFGGQDGSANPCSTFSDVWALSGANGLSGSPAWTKLSTFTESGAGPAGQYGPAAAYDPTTQVMTLFGGTGTINHSCQASNAVWELSLQNAVPVWQNVIPEGATGSPAARSFHSGVYDATGGRMLIFGGSRGNGNLLDDVWSLSNATGFGTPAWTQLAPSGGPPPARAGQAAIFDPTNQLMTIFGGNGLSGGLNDTWVLSAPGVSGLSCSAVATPLTIRAEGLADLLGDDILMCTGGTPTPAGEPIPDYTLTLKLNTDVTSRPLPQGEGLSEALLLIDEPFPSEPVPSFLTATQQQPPQILCEPLGAVCSETGTGGASSPYRTQANVFVGAQTGADALQWKVPIDPPGVNAVRVIRLTNLRANAQKPGPPSTSTQPQVAGALTIQGSQTVPLNNSPVTLGAIQPAISTTTSGTAVPKCQPHNASLEGGAGPAAFDFTVQVTETFPYSFRVRNYGSILFGSTYPADIAEQNVTGFDYSTESGLYLPSLLAAAPDAGLADTGTRIRLVFSGVRTGTQIFVPVTITTQGDFGGRTPGQLQLVKSDIQGDNGPGYVPVTATAMVGTTPVAELSTSGSTRYATYEVIYDNPFVAETAAIPVAVAYSSSQTQISGLGSVSVNAALAPVSSVGTAVSSAPVPRFTGMSATEPAFSFYSCPTAPLTGSIASKSGPRNARLWTIAVSGGASPAVGAQIDSLSLVQATGQACTPALVSPASFPLALGNIPAGGTSLGHITLDFSSCRNSATFNVTIPLSADGGAWTGTIHAKRQLP